MRCLFVLLFVGLMVGHVQAQSATETDPFLRRSFREAWLQAEAAWRAAEVSGKLRDAGLAAAKVGAALTMLGRFDEAERWQNRAQAAFETIPANKLLGRLAVARAITTFLRDRQFGYGDSEQALAYIQTAKRHLSAEDNRLVLVELELLGQSNKSREVEAAYMGYTRLIGQYAKTGDSLKVARCAARLARLDGDTGGHGEALVRSLRAGAIFVAEEHWREAAFAVRNAGHALRKQKHRAYGDAEKQLTEALTLAQKSSDPGIRVRVLNDLSRLYAEVGNDSLAVQYDKQTDEALASIASEVRAGRFEDSVMLDYLHLLLLRYANLLPYEVDLFDSFYDQLVVAE